MTADPVAAELARMRERVEAASSGPWWADDRNQIWPMDWPQPDEDDEALITVLGMIGDDDTRADAAFIAAARTDVPRLLDALEAVLDVCVTARVDDWDCVPTERIRRAITAALASRAEVPSA